MRGNPRVAWAGLLLAGALYMVDPLEPYSHSVAPLGFLTADYVGRGSIVDDDVNGAIQIRNASATSNEVPSGFFGMDMLLRFSLRCFARTLGELSGDRTTSEKSQKWECITLVGELGFGINNAPLYRL